MEDLVPLGKCIAVAAINLLRVFLLGQIELPMQSICPGSGDKPDPLIDPLRIDLIEPIGCSEEEGEQHRTVLTQVDPRIGITGSHHLEQDAFNPGSLFLRIALAWNDQEIESLATLLIHNKMAANFLGPFDIVDRMDDCLDLARTSLEQELHGYRVEGVLERLVTQPTLRDGVLRNHIVQLCTNMGNLISRSLHGFEGEQAPDMDVADHAIDRRLSHHEVVNLALAMDAGIPHTLE